MATDEALGIVAADQKRWSLTANHLNLSIGRWRVIVLLLAICGAILETWAAQNSNAANAAKLCAYVGSAAIALIAVVRQWKLGRDRVQGWIMARAASESLKREMYLFRSSAGAYSSANNKESLLLDNRDAVLNKVRAAETYIVEPRKVDNVLPTIDAPAYVSERVDGQINWFRAKATQAATAQGRFEVAEFLLTALAALLGASLTVAPKNQLGAWVAVITTIVGALGAHVQTQRYGQLTINYRTTASRLEGIKGRWRSLGGSLPQLVDLCEAVLFEENQGWIAGADESLKGTASRAADEPSAPAGTPTEPDGAN